MTRPRFSVPHQRPCPCPASQAAHRWRVNCCLHGVDTFTPIITPPQAAILGIGRLLRKPVVVADDRIEARTRLSLSLTFDHRLVDGAPAARFLARVTQLIELPYLTRRCWNWKKCFTSTKDRRQPCQNHRAGTPPSPIRLPAAALIWPA
ncbi:MAG: 2-oxo acid dehydrogenase subunit E2 [Anaerolineae bacterium]|nr:2-oxo acid dehydrogenase subunit E2 [Anaerolineae bacterium]MBK9094301.1 2-oxo acid dehydrogenase subunit E2 [Anaerolineae bacterium]